MKYFVPLLLLLCGSCAPVPSREQPAPVAAKDSGRRSDPAMLFYEQAERDMDPGSVIVIPPQEKASQDAP